ncbi:hypothetical protein LLEC1_00581 [Akanthomyces lecanii]|uniref:Aminoglycoside N(3)-acetyltransferase n=1 Tax=Cordyceps confragosa TaxID=2714763 RepID=A0A179IBF5_CORDF|nr:hypothetical protein LLEC1_00581 [Akanthomyces lecanii]
MTPEKPDTRSLCTRASLAKDLDLVLGAGDTVLVHSSLSKVGWVCGGAEALVRAVLDVIRESGTLVVPTHTSDNSDPEEWRAPPVPESWWPTIRASMPAFDPAVSRTRQMGVVAETVRGWPAMRRSAHPQTSFAAVGSRAATITAGHRLDSMMGDESPLARLESVVGAKVLLLGVGWDRCTAFHLAESRLASPRKANSFAAMVDGNRQWVTVEDMEADSSDFEALGTAFEAQTGAVIRLMIGTADSRVFSMSSAIEFAEKWLHQNRAK